MERVLWLLQFGGAAVLVVITLELHFLTDVAFWSIIIVFVKQNWSIKMTRLGDFKAEMIQINRGMTLGYAI